jgi:V/A-type H+-transporting ATPase subunit F
MAVYDVGVVGDLDSVIGYRGLGMTVVPVNDAVEARRAVRDLADKNYGVIFLTEALAAELADTIAEYRIKLLPALILIPSVQGGAGTGRQMLRDSVRRAVGMDLLGDRSRKEETRS